MLSMSKVCAREVLWDDCFVLGLWLDALSRPRRVRERLLGAVAQYVGTVEKLL